ncbi:MAG: 16S rRNA (adenine(1518)-N(6)/adenine(1519)-N(6))-dimethyltransferase RsmA [Clostridia bacterium]
MEIRETLVKYGFRYKKSLGQNFITDSALLKAIVKDAGIAKEDTVIEIGAGAGTLTREIAEAAGKVIAFEVDKDLKLVLQDVLSGAANVQTVFSDILKMSDSEVAAVAGGEFKVVANLPYYITTPIIMRFIESGLPIKSLTVMVQKEVAERLAAKESTPEYGAVTLAVRLRGDAKITRIVNRRLFYPQPNVDSAVIRIDIDDNRYAFQDKNTLLKLIKAGFAMRRKTLVNNISAAFSYSKEYARELLDSLGYDQNIRGEALSIEDYIKIADKIFTN